MKIPAGQVRGDFFSSEIFPSANLVNVAHVH